MSTQIIAPSVDVDFGDKSYFSPSRVVMSLHTGGIPTCSVYGQAIKSSPDETKVVDMLNEEISKNIGDLQKKLFRSRPTPDAVITINDGQGGTVVFKGFFSSPAYSNSAGSIGSSRTVVHQSAILSAYRGWIYGTSRTAREIMAGGGPLQGIKDSNMAQRTARILEATVKSWVENKPEVNDISEEAEKILRLQHAENERIKPYLLAALNASDVTYESVAKLNPGDQDDINGFISSNIILAHNNSFLDNLAAFEQAFQATLVPLFGTSDPVAKFIKNRLVMEDAGGLDLKFIDINYSGGDRRMLPVACAVIQNHAGSTLRGTIQVAQPNNPETLIYAYPGLEQAYGEILYDTGPPWLSAVDTSTGGISPARDKKARADEGLSIDEWGAKREAHNKDCVDTVDDQHAPIIREWCRNLYTFAALEGSYANLGCPLTVPMTPGARYDVTNSDGRKLLSGFLQQVTHTISVDSRPPSANTVLSFSHIEAGDFKLPADT